MRRKKRERPRSVKCPGRSSSAPAKGGVTGEGLNEENQEKWVKGPKKRDRNGFDPTDKFTRKKAGDVMQRPKGY